MEKQYTVTFIDPDIGRGKYECHARDGEHAEDQFFEVYPEATIVFTFAGHRDDV